MPVTQEALWEAAVEAQAQLGELELSKTLTQNERGQGKTLSVGDWARVHIRSVTHNQADYDKG